MTDPQQPILFAIPANPLPPGIRAGYVTDAAGKRIRYAVLPAQAARSPKGTVLLLSGRNETIEKYLESASDLSARGFAVVMLDWRGQGGSDRLLRDPMRGHVTDFGQYVDDLLHVFDEIAVREAPEPYFVLAHSTGALVALLAAPRLAGRIRRMVLASALLEIAGFPLAQTSIARLARLLTGSGLGRIYLGGGPRRAGMPEFAGNPLTHDPQRFRRNAELLEAFPQLALGGPTAAWVHAACRAIAAVHRPDFMASLRIPTLFVASGGDRVVSSRAIAAYAPRLRMGALVTIDGAQHELLQEADRFREQLFAAFDAFVPGSERGV